MEEKPIKVKDILTTPAYIEVIKEDGKLLAVDEKGLIRDIMFYSKDDNKITMLGGDDYLDVYTVHGYAMKYYFSVR